VKLEQMLLTGETNNVMNTYPELESEALSVQLKMFVQHYKPRTMYCAKEASQLMSSDTRLLFSQVEQFLRLLLVCPAALCEAERSFSALRRIKTWLRNSMTQVRLNSAAVCHVHKERVDTVTTINVAVDFASRSDTRRAAFGNC
jgi:hAT family C-terminal dimerisation region